MESQEGVEDVGETCAEHVKAEVGRQIELLSKNVQRNLRLKTDFRKTFGLNMEFSTEEAKYISQPKETLERNAILKRIFGDRGDITVIDAFACVGGDSVSLMYEFRLCHLHSVQRGETADEKQRFDRLCRNVTMAKNKFAPGSSVHIHKLPISDAFSEIKKSVTKVELLYLDPPWYDVDGRLNLESMCVLISENIFDPMHSCGIEPEFICLKLDFKPIDLQTSDSFKALIKRYKFVSNVGVKRKTGAPPVYYFHILGKVTSLGANLSTVDARLDSILLSLSNHSNY
jgi:hypothetical protein